MIFKRTLSVVLCVIVIATVIPFGIFTSAQGNTINDVFDNVDKWEDIKANYYNTDSADIPEGVSSGVITLGGTDSKVLIPARAGKARQAYASVIKDGNWNTETALQSFKTSVYIEKSSSFANNNSVYVYLPVSKIKGANIAPYWAIEIQLHSNNGKLQWRFNQFKYDESKTYKCNEVPGSTYSPDISTDAFLDLEVSYDYSQIEDNKLTITATFKNGDEVVANASKSQTFEFTGAPSNESEYDEAAEIIKYNVFDNNFKVGFGSTATSKGARASDMYFGVFTADFAKSDLETAGEFEAKYQDLISLEKIEEETQADNLLICRNEYDKLTVGVKENISASFKQKIEKLYDDYFSDLVISKEDFSNSLMFGETWEILGGTPPIYHPGLSGEIPETVVTKENEFTVKDGVSAYLPEYRGTTRQRSVAVIKDKYCKENSQVKKYSIDIYPAKIGTYVYNPCIYFYYKDINNWARLKWEYSRTSDGKDGDGNTIYKKDKYGNDIYYFKMCYETYDGGEKTTTVNLINGIENFTFNDWYTVEIQYDYRDTYTDIKFFLVLDGYTLYSGKSTVFGMKKGEDFKVGIGAASASASSFATNSHTSEIYFSNLNIEWTLLEGEVDMKEINTFLTDFSDVLNSAANEERVLEAANRYFTLTDLSREYLNANHNALEILCTLCEKILDESGDAFQKNHKEILSKNVNDVTANDKIALYEALKAYNALNAVAKLKFYSEGELLRAMQGKTDERENEEDFSPFYDDFENGTEMWERAFTNSDRYVFETVTDPENSANKVLKASGYSVFHIPTNDFWPKSGKMVKVHLRMKHYSTNKLNMPYVLFSYKDIENYYTTYTRLPPFERLYYAAGYMGGVKFNGYKTNSDTVLDINGWIDVDITYSGTNASITFTDEKGNVFSMVSNYFEAGRLGLGYDVNASRRTDTNCYSGDTFFDDVYVEFVEGDWDDDEEITSVIPYNVGNVWYTGNDLVTVTGEKIGTAVSSLKVMRLPDSSFADYTKNYTYITETTFENNGKDYVVLGSKSNLDFTNADSIPFQHKSTESFQFILPENYKDGIYALEMTPVNPNEEKTVVLINKPRISAVIGDEGKIATRGGTIRIIGENLAPKGKATDLRVALKNLSGGEDYFLTPSVNEDDNYNLSVSVPTDLPYGEYAVFVYNGYGTNACWSAPGSIKIAESPRDSWPTRVFNVTDKKYGAVGDGTTNDTGAIYKALEDAEKNGGGVVYLPKGMYRVIYTLTIPENVVLKGDGSNVSMIIWTATKWQYGDLPQTLLATTKNVEIKGLTLRGTRAFNYVQTYGESTDVIYDFTNNENIYLTDINAYFWRRAGAPSNGGHSGYPTDEMSPAEIEVAIMAEMVGSYSLAINGSNVQLNGYKLNTDKQITSSACRAAYMYTEYLQIRNSEIMKGTIHGSCRTAAIIEDSKFGPDAPQFMSLSHAYVSRCTYFSQTQNNHEMFLNDHTPKVRKAVVQFIDDELATELGIASRSEYVKGKTFRFTNYTCGDDTLNGYVLTVAQGQGTGQVRPITDTFNVGKITYITIENEFAVNPNRNSFVFAQQPRASRTVVNNTFKDGGAVGTYGTAINEIYDNNTIEGSAAGFSYNTHFGVIWYLSVVNNLITADSWTHGETAGSDGNTAGHSTETRYYFYTISEYLTPDRAYLFRNNNSPNGAHFYMQISNTRGICDFVIQGNTIANTKYPFKTDTVKSDYTLFDGLTFYNNNFDDCEYDYSEGILNDMSNEANVNKLGDYCIGAIGESGDKAGQKLGDVNFDGKISVKDVAYIRYHIHGLLTLNEAAFAMADFDSDGQVTMRDALLIREYILSN